METDFLSEWKKWFSKESGERLVKDRLEAMVASYLWPRVELPAQPKHPRTYVDEALGKLKERNPMEEWQGSEHIVKYVLQTAINQIKNEIRATRGRITRTETEKNETRKRQPKVPVLPENWALFEGFVSVGTASLGRIPAIKTDLHEPVLPIAEMLERVNKICATNPVFLEVLDCATECWREEEAEATQRASEGEDVVTVTKPKKGIMQFPVTDIIKKSGLAPAVVAGAVKQIRKLVGVHLMPAYELFRNGQAKSFGEAVGIVQQRKRPKRIARK